MLAARHQHRGLGRIGLGPAEDHLSEPRSAPHGLEVATAGVKACASDRSPRRRAEPHGPVGTRCVRAVPAPGSVVGPLERHPNRPPSPSLALGSQTQAAGGLQVGAPAGSGRSTRPPAAVETATARPLHVIRPLLLARAGTRRGVPASFANSKPPAWEAGIKEEYL